MKKSFGKMLNKGVCLVLAMCFLLSIGGPAYANYTPSIEDEQETVTVEARKITWVSWAAKAIYWLIEQINDELYEVEAETEVGDNYVRVSSGSIEYNDGENGPTSQIDIEAATNFYVNGKPDLTISISASTSFITALSSVISVYVMNSETDESVVNQNLGHNGITAFSVDNTRDEGTYNAMFTTSENKKWTTSVQLIDFNAPTSRALEDEDALVIDWNNNRYYKVPTQIVDEYQTASMGGSPKSVEELYNEFWDEGVGDFVYSLASYAIDDKIVVEDEISSITYEEDLDRTVLTFSTEYGDAPWPFDGDLRERFSVGDMIQFEFSVVEEYSDGMYTFENIDYFKTAMEKLMDSEVSLKIDDYLVV